MDSLLEIRLKEAKNGRQYWLYLQEKYKLSALDYVLLIPGYENIIHLKKQFLKYIQKKSGTKGKGIILAKQEVLKNIYITREESLYTEVCTNHMAENLIRFYCTYQFTSNLLVASLETPDGRIGGKLIGQNGLDREEILDMVVFGIERGQETGENSNGF